jgi:hypothetical protein
LLYLKPKAQREVRREKWKWKWKQRGGEGRGPRKQEKSKKICPLPKYHPIPEDLIGGRKWGRRRNGVIFSARGLPGAASFSYENVSSGIPYY